MNEEKIIDVIRENGYKITKPRRAIISILLLYQNNLLTIENILINAKNIYENINLTTIYRNIEMLQSLNMIHKCIASDGTSLYKLSCNDEHHHHLICKYCGKTEYIEFCPLNQLIQISMDKDFTLIDHKIELYGYCRDCNLK